MANARFLIWKYAVGIAKTIASRQRFCYGIDVKDIPQQRNLIENIKASPNWECKRLRQHKRGAENYFPKQVGFSRDGLTAITDEEFIELVANHIEFYLQVMKDWE